MTRQVRLNTKKKGEEMSHKKTEGLKKETDTEERY
jgi:hypothetical protein